MTDSPTSNQALVQRLREHADLHDDLSKHSIEQLTWANDLRTAANLLETGAPQPPPAMRRVCSQAEKISEGLAVRREFERLQSENDELRRRGSDAYEIERLQRELENERGLATQLSRQSEERRQRIEELCSQLTRRAADETPATLSQAINEYREARAQLWKKRSDGDPACAHCGRTWDMHVIGGICPTPPPYSAPFTTDVP